MLDVFTHFSNVGDFLGSFTAKKKKNTWWGKTYPHSGKYVRQGFNRLFGPPYSANSVQNSTRGDFYGPTGSIVGKY